MVQHRHILSATADLPTFLQQIRNKLKCLIREGILLQMIKSGEKLYDMNCIKGIKTEGTALIIIGTDFQKVQPYRFHISISENAPDYKAYKANAERGRIRHSIFEETGWEYSSHGGM